MVYFAQGTLNPSSTTLANDIRMALYNSLTAAITAGYTTWSIVDQGYTVGGNIRTVIKNSNGFVAQVNNSTTTTTLTVGWTLAQSYTLATHTLNNTGLSSTSSSTTTNATGFSGVNSAVATGQTWTATSTQYAWALSLEADHLIFTVATSSTTALYIYLGAFTPRTDVNPAVGTDSNPYIMFSNFPAAPYVVFLNSFNNFSVAGIHSGAFNPVSTTFNSSPSNGNYRDANFNNFAFGQVSLINVMRASVNPPSTATDLGWKRGTMKNSIIHGYTNGSVWGDTLSLTTATYFSVLNDLWIRYS